MPDDANRLRIDKWLWAARFFKTRSLAKSAIEGGKVQIGGQRVKVSKEIGVGDVISLRTGWDERVITVIALSDQRRGAPEAQKLYAETEESIAKREHAALMRRAAGQQARPDHRPDKHERRQLLKVQREFDV
jgi:ribosome-associated heat shock protein Hsp15